MKLRKGFTLIELMIVIAIIAIIAAIAIPNLMQSRIRANEATAMTAAKNYNTAQVTFQVGRQGRNSIINTSPGPRGYVFNYRNLFYGQAWLNTTSVLGLISKAHADAFITSDAGGGTAPNGMVDAGAQTPYAGYHFGNPPELQAIGDFASNFGQVAVPANSSSTGNNVYWVGQEGTVYSMGIAPGETTPEDAYALVTLTPSDSTNTAAYSGWEGL